MSESKEKPQGLAAFDGQCERFENLSPKVLGLFQAASVRDRRVLQFGKSAETIQVGESVVTLSAEPYEESIIMMFTVFYKGDCYELSFSEDESGKIVVFQKNKSVFPTLCFSPAGDLLTLIDESRVDDTALIFDEILGAFEEIVKTPSEQVSFIQEETFNGVNRLLH